MSDEIHIGQSEQEHSVAMLPDGHDGASTRLPEDTGSICEPEIEPDGGFDDAESESGVLEAATAPQAPAGQVNDRATGGTLDSDQVKYEYRCKICQLSVRAPSLYRRVHELVLKDKASYGQALNEVNTYIKQHGLDIKLLNMVNMSGHFSKHINIAQRVALVVAQAQPAAQQLPVPVQQQVTQLVRQTVGNEVDDFNNLDDIRVRITNQLYKLEGQLEVIDPKDNKVKFDKMALQLYMSLVGEIRACIGDLNKMRQSERLMNTVVQQLLDRMTFAIIPQLLEEYAVITDELRHNRVPDDIIKMVDERLRMKTAQIIAQTARAAVTEIQRQFKLR